MSWYYIKRGSLRSRSVLTDEQLAMMVRAGEINERDLLWGSSTGGKWAHAESIPDLFPTEEPAPVPQPQEANEEPVDGQDSPTQEKSHSRMSAAVAVIIAVIAITGVLSAGKLKGLLKPDDPPPPPPTPPPVETNTWETVEQDVAGLLAAGNYYEAQTTIAEYMADRGSDDASTRMTASLRLAVDKTRLSELYQSYIQGKITEEEKDEMISLAKALKVDTDLANSLNNILIANKPPSAAKCMEILRLAEILGNSELCIAAIDKYAAVVDYSTSEKTCLRIVKLYTEKNETDKAIAILHKFTVWNPKSPEAWLELAALLAVKGKTDECLDALKTAVRHGDDITRKEAREDKRFDPVRDTWTFGRYTK